MLSAMKASFARMDEALARGAGNQSLGVVLRARLVRVRLVGP